MKKEKTCKNKAFAKLGKIYIIKFTLFITLYPLDPLSILIFVLLIVLSAFFSGTEIALMTVSKHAVQSLVREKRWGSKSLEKIKSDTDKLLITILIGNNIVNTGAAALATVLSVSLAVDLNLPDEYGILIATVAVTLILLLFGEITPKTICARYNLQISLLVAPIYRALLVLFAPISFFLNIFVKGVARLFGGAYTKKISYAEVEAFIDMSHEEGEVEADERRQIKNLLGLSDMTADSVMTPRVNVEFLSLDMTIDDACTFLMNSSHSRFPVCGETTDDINYVITFREAFKLQRDGHGNTRLRSLSLEKIMKVPLTQSLDDLFEKFQRSRRHIALVLDEHGGTAGVVTMEDVLEEVFGDIKDEKDKEEIYIKKRADGKIEAIGSVLIDDILEEWNIHANDIGLPDEYNGESLAYVIMAEQEEFPMIGVEVILGSRENQIKLKVLEVNDNVIERVECTKKVQNP